MADVGNLNAWKLLKESRIQYGERVGPKKAHVISSFPFSSFKKFYHAALKLVPIKNKNTDKNLKISDYFKRAVPTRQDKHLLGSDPKARKRPGNSLCALLKAREAATPLFEPVSPENLSGLFSSEHLSFKNKPQTLRFHSQIPQGIPINKTRATKYSKTSTQHQIEIGIKKAARKYNVPENIIRAVIRAESGFNHRAVSPCGAKGLMQLMPATARELGVKDVFDIEQNIEGGTKYLKKMLNRFNGDIVLALAAYNAGPGTVRKYKGVPPYKETKLYISRVLKYSRSPSYVV